MSTLWSNRVVTVKRKSLFIRNRFDTDILFISDLLDYKLVDSFTNKHYLPCTQKEYRQVYKDVPVAIRQLIYNTMVFSTVKPVLPNLKIGKSDRKLGNKVINTIFKLFFFYDYIKGRFFTILQLSLKRIQQG